jgi:hypothetical protein
VEVHKKIRNFFEQFKQDSDFERIRRQLTVPRILDFSKAVETMDVEGIWTEQLSSEEKVR